MKYRYLLWPCLCFVAAMLLAFWIFKGAENELPMVDPSSIKAKPTKPYSQPQIITAPIDNLQRGLELASGELHIESMETIMSWLRQQQVLSADDRKMLLEYLQQGQPMKITSGEWEERVNELLNLLRAQNDGTPGLADLLLHMAVKDPNHVLRMYALQHISLWIPDEPSTEKRQALIDHLKRLAVNPADPLAGSAVLFLSDLKNDGIINEQINDSETLGQASLKIMSDNKAAPEVRISALHACVEQGYAEALPNARDIAADTTLMIPLRKAAIHYIGTFGTAEDAARLESLAAQKPELTAASKPALARLRQEK
jgi:hypothetical protein